MGREIPWGTLELQDHQTCSDQKNLILVGIWDRGDYPGRHLHTNTQGRRSGPWSEWNATLFDTRSHGGKASTDPNPCYSLSITNPGVSPQEGEAQEISSQRPSPEVHDPEHLEEGLWKIRTQLGGSLHYHCSQRQWVIHPCRSGNNQLNKQWNSFHLKWYHV